MTTVLAQSREVEEKKGRREEAFREDRAHSIQFNAIQIPNSIELNSSRWKIRYEAGARRH